MPGGRVHPVTTPLAVSVRPSVRLFPPCLFNQLTFELGFVPARRYASVGISCRRVSVCVSVTPLTRRYCIETAAQIETICCLQLSLDLCYTQHTLCFREIRVSLKTRVLPSGTLSQTLDRR